MRVLRFYLVYHCTDEGYEGEISNCIMWFVVLACRHHVTLPLVIFVCWILIQDMFNLYRFGCNKLNWWICRTRADFGYNQTKCAKV
jgi:hypothetical protein